MYFFVVCELDELVFVICAKMPKHTPLIYKIKLLPFHFINNFGLAIFALKTWIELLVEAPGEGAVVVGEGLDAIIQFQLRLKLLIKRITIVLRLVWRGNAFKAAVCVFFVEDLAGLLTLSFRSFKKQIILWAHFETASFLLDIV